MKLVQMPDDNNNMFVVEHISEIGIKKGYRINGRTGIDRLSKHFQFRTFFVDF